MKNITITFPDDWHCHLREGEYLLRTVNDTAARFQRALVMPNLRTPITTVAAAQQYREQIFSALQIKKDFDPLMTLYLTESIKADTIRAAKESGFIVACKLYPAGATTNSAAGVTNLQKIYPVLAAMQEHNLVLCIHGESIEPDVDVFDREKHFVDNALQEIMKNFPGLRIVLEHISTAYATDFVRSAPANLAATITAHHLLLNRNAIFRGGLHPHYFCLPVLKRNQDQQALIKAATSGDAKFFLGSDSAPHAKTQKESPCGCAGIYTAHAALELYTQVFAQHNALAQLENFASLNGAKFYQLPVNTNKVTLTHNPWQVPQTLSYAQEESVPLFAGETIDWRIESTE